MRKDTRRQNPGVVVDKQYKLIKEKKTPTHVKDNLTAIVKEREELVNRLEECYIEANIHRAQEPTRQILSSITQNRRLFDIKDEKTVEDDCESNLNIAQDLLGNIIHSVQTKSKVTDENACIRSWIIFSKPSVRYPGVVLRTSFDTLAQKDDEDILQRIQSVKFHLKGLAEKSDLLPALKLCEEEADIQRFTDLLEQFLHLNDARQTRIKEALKEECFTQQGPNILELRGPGNQILLQLVLNIKFSLTSLNWSETWSCKLTAAGSAALSSLGLPAEKIEDGSYQDWSTDYAIETLGKMAALEPTPTKKDKTGGGGLTSPLPASDSSASQLNHQTPFNSQTRRPPKRRLN